MVVVEVLGGVVAASLLTALGLSVKIVREYQRIVPVPSGGVRLDQKAQGSSSSIRSPTGHHWWTSGAVPRDSPADRHHAGQRVHIHSTSSSFTKVVDPRPCPCSRCRTSRSPAQNVAATTLRSVVGDIGARRRAVEAEEMNASLRIRLDDVTERWGCEGHTVEVREVNPPSVSSKR